MNNLIVKNVDALGDSIIAAKDEEGIIWPRARIPLIDIGYTHKPELELVLLNEKNNLKCSKDKAQCRKITY